MSVHADKFWRPLVGGLIAILLAVCGWIAVYGFDRLDKVESEIGKVGDDISAEMKALQQLAASNAVAIAGLIETQSGDEKIRTALVKRFEDGGDGITTNLAEIKLIQASNQEAIQGLRERMARVETKLDIAPP